MRTVIVIAMILTFLALAGCRLTGPARTRGAGGAAAGPTEPGGPPPRPEPVAPPPKPRTGVLRALSYNIHGLPSMVARTQVERNVPLISPKLNDYDLALIQEDFVHHHALAQYTNHAHQSRPMAHGNGRVLNDGLSRFSRFPFSRLLRVKWAACNGIFKGASDCLARKGFSVATTTVADGVEIDVYNLHAEAGGGKKDKAARREGITQLGRFIQEHSAGKAVIVGGDFNLHQRRPIDMTLFQELLAATGLTDVAAHLGANLHHIDRFLFRSGGGITIVPESWAVDRSFVDDLGVNLSDHPAIDVTFRWTVE